MTTGKVSKKARKVSRGVIKDIIIVVIGVFSIWFGIAIVFGSCGPIELFMSVFEGDVCYHPFYVVSSGSMVPVLNVGDVLLVESKTPFEEIRIGDIIVFNRPSDHDRVIVHRVASIIDDEPFTIRTKGDHNPASIAGTDFPITEDDYIGKVMSWIPEVGKIVSVMKPPVNYVVIAVIIAIMIFKQISKSKKEDELGYKSLNMESDKAEISSVTLDELKKIPKDNEYSSLKKKENSADETKEKE